MDDLTVPQLDIFGGEQMLEPQLARPDGSAT
jgi:hypothetical protein